MLNAVARRLDTSARRLAAAMLIALAPILQATAETLPDVAREIASSVGNGAAGSEAGTKETLRRFSLFDFGDRPALRLTPAEAPMRAVFGHRLDEEVVKATVRVRYAYSPMLIPAQSHLRVLLNDDIVAVLPVTREGAGREITREVTLPADAVKRFSHLKLEFIGHYTNDCENPIHSGLWLDILRGSEISLVTRPVASPGDLAQLPAPFFDSQDFGRLELPVIFASGPSAGTLQAAGIVSSWFGKLAAWRGARFPVLFDGLPVRHAVVFATNSERPPFLRELPPLDGPSLSIIDNPASTHGKLLLIAGRDAQDLQHAARALTLGETALSGRAVAIRDMRIDKPRKAYDAPNWVRQDRPMKFGELVESPQQLQVFGHLPPGLKFDLRIPPDLFTWHSRGVPVDLKLRYTPPARAADSKLRMAINGEQVQEIRLRASGVGGDSTHVVLPLLGSALLGEGREMLIPAFRLGTRNTLEYVFSFGYLDAGACRDVQIESTRAMIDPDSTVDFTGYPHYTEMPNLGFFATSGFPFTKFADLSQTAVVLPRNPNADEIAVMLGLLARMGESTGHPATRVSVAWPDEVTALHGRDLLVIGTSSRQPLLRAWRDDIPAVIDGPTRGIRPPEDTLDKVLAWFGKRPAMPADPKAQKHVRGEGPLAALLAMESPFTKGRSVVMATAVEDGDLPQLLDTLDDDKAAKSMLGSVVLIHGGVTESLYAGKTYEIGSLPPWTAIWFPLSAHPVLLASMSVIAVLVFAFALWRSLRAVAARRLAETSGQKKGDTHG